MNSGMKQSIIERYTGFATGNDHSCCRKENSGGVSPREATREVVSLDLGCGAPLEHADLGPGMTVLDLGSGSGRELFLASEIVGGTGRVIGIDMTESMVELARRNAEHLGVRNAKFHLAEIEKMPIGDDSVDRIISNCVLNLTPDKDASFREMFRVLKPGGRFAVSDVVSTGRLPEAVRGDHDLWCSCVGGAIPVDDYVGGLRSAGFTDIDVVSRTPRPLGGLPGLVLLSVTITGTKP